MRILASLALTIALASAQPSFEVAVVKPSNPTPGPNDRTASTLNDRFTATGFTLLNLMILASQVKDYQIEGGPSWLRTARYDVAAKASRPITKIESWSMLKTLLEDRFKLKVRSVTRESRIYTLTLATTGPKIPPSTGPLPGSQTNYRWVLPHIDIDTFAHRLSRELDRPVIDKTGLAGFYSVTLEWGPDGPSIFTAIEEQLGLKLTASKEPIQVLIVESAERPADQ